MFISRVKILRLQRGWTQQELATRAGVSSVTIGNVERNFKSPTLNTLELIIDAFNSDGQDIVCMHSIIRFKCKQYNVCTLDEKELSNCY